VHYEVSSYARPGQHAVHNSLYWRGGEYLGLGMSAHSFRRLPAGGGERFANPRELDAYLAAPAGPPAQTETLSPEALRKEAIWLWLRRLDEGIVRAEFARLYGADPVIEHAATVDGLLAEGLVELSPAALRLSPRGMLHADSVALRFL
jgi:oxygen-independent coproporphyrinogen-3 oxidase